MFLVSKLVFSFSGQNRKSSVNIMLHIYPLYCDAGPGCLIKIVRKYGILIVITGNIFVLVRLIFWAVFYFRDALALLVLGESYTFVWESSRLRSRAVTFFS